MIFFSIMGIFIFILIVAFIISNLFYVLFYKKEDDSDVIWLEAMWATIALFALVVSILFASFIYYPECFNYEKIVEEQINVNEYKEHPKSNAVLTKNPNL